MRLVQATHGVLVALVCSLWGCSTPGSGSGPTPSGAPSAAANKEDLALSSAKGAAAKLGGAVRAKLMDAMNAGGVASAINVCSTEAQGIAAQVSKETGATVGRSSLKLRNPKDAPPGWVQTWLVAQGDKKAAETQGIEGVFDSPSGRVARVLKPLAIDGVCLSCHGAVAEIPPEVKEVLAAKYPGDQATGYQLGELRGALWAEVPVPR